MTNVSFNYFLLVDGRGTSTAPCARGWWMMAVPTGLPQEIHGTSFYYRLLLIVPHIMGILS